MRVMNFNDPVSMADGSLKTLDDLGGDVAGFTVETFKSDSTPKTLESDGMLIVANNGDSTAGNLTVNVPDVKRYTITMQNGNVFVCPVTPGTTVSITNDAGMRNAFFYYH